MCATILRRWSDKLGKSIEALENWCITPRTLELQGDQNQNFWFQMAVPLKVCISDPMLVKPKCDWEAVVFLKNCKQTAEKCKQIFENWKKKLPPLKRILALLI